MDWKAKKHITEQLNLHCHRTAPVIKIPAQHKIDIRRHRQTVVNLVQTQIGKCNCKFDRIVKNTQR